MNLKKTILDVMRRDDLKAMVNDAKLEQVDRRSFQSMRDALARSRRVQPEMLLNAMVEGQVKAVCERMGIDPKGRKKALIRRLLETSSNHALKTPQCGTGPTDQSAVSQPAPDQSPLAKISVTKMELVWPDKYNEDGILCEVPRVRLPFQVIETINESRATRDAQAAGIQPTMFDVYRGNEGDTFEDGWRNKLIWGDNLLVMGSLLEKFAGKIDLIYIDPPFATGADFSFETQVGESGENILKNQSIIEEKAYRDTWGKGIDSFITMLHKRLVLMRELLAESGSIYVHCDWRMTSLVRLCLNEIFGANNYVNECIWLYKTGGMPEKLGFGRKHDTLHFVVKNKSKAVWNKQKEKSYLAHDYGFSNIELSKDEIGTFRLANARDVWDIAALRGNQPEKVCYPTQKPKALLDRIVRASSKEGNIVADFFCGSGTSLAVAERLGRRWIGCDLGRWGIHVTRKRLLGIENCKPFEVLNLGKYERQYWQGASFAGSDSAHVTETALYEYLAFILKLYRAAPVTGLSYLHGRKNRAMVHIGAVDAPVTIGDVNAAVDECVKLRQKELHVLGWEWEMGLDLMVNVAKAKGVKLLSLQIPCEVMEQQAVEKGDVRFFELAYLKAVVQTPRKLTARVKLEDFVIPNPELIPEDVRSKVKKWSDYIDYWAVDWDFQHDTFMQGWVTYRTRRDRSLALVSGTHTYPKAGRYRALVKVIDIFGNDTSQLLDVRVK